MKMFFFKKNGVKMWTQTPALAEHWYKHGAKLTGVHRFSDIRSFYNLRGSFCRLTPLRRR
jgi:hypothetical protein